MISNFFIDRPLFATVVSAFIVIAGLAAFRQLPVAMFPNIAPPQISVTTVYPGASAEVIAETVAQLAALPADARPAEVERMKREALTISRGSATRGAAQSSSVWCGQPSKRTTSSPDS